MTPDSTLPVAFCMGIGHVNDGHIWTAYDGTQYRCIGHPPAPSARTEQGVDLEAIACKIDTFFHDHGYRRKDGSINPNHLVFPEYRMEALLKEIRTLCRVQ